MPQISSFLSPFVNLENEKNRMFMANHGEPGRVINKEKSVYMKIFKLGSMIKNVSF
jgi:hypothetical protein